MQIIRDWKRTKLKRSSVAIGVFDGVHLGHKAILDAALTEARRKKLSPVVLTMDPHPSQVLHPDRRDPLIYSLAHRLRIFQEMGFKTTVVLKFNRALAGMEAGCFARTILSERVDARFVAVGKNFRFGCKASGDADFLTQSGGQLGFSVKAVSPVRSGGTVVSSSRIRAAVLAGDFKLALRLLGRPYALSGKVVRGDGRGSKIGFPTINLKLEHELLPQSGVYAVWAKTDDKRYPGAMHLGPRPTFDSSEPRTEIHLLDTPKKSFYGKPFQIIPVCKIRPIRRFRTPTALIRQIRLDIQKTRLSLTQNSYF